MALESRNRVTFRALDPWSKYAQRDESKYEAEDRHLCSPQQSTTMELIEQFMSHGYSALIEPIPRKRQVLRRYLESVLTKPPFGQGPSCEVDISHPMLNAGIAALLDDRHDHKRCTRLIERTCNNTRVFCGNLSTIELYNVLHEARRARKAERRMIFIPNMTSATALVLISAISRRSAIPMRDMMHRYLTREVMFSIVTNWGFFLEFHLPYHALRREPLSQTQDNRDIRKSKVLPLQEKGDPHILYYHEATISSLCWGPDEWFWTELFLVDTYFGSEHNLATYLEPTTGNVQERLDPPLAGGQIENACYDPRKYWLMKLSMRLSQVSNEYTTLIETFNSRIGVYIQTPTFTNDSSRHTQTLSDVLDTIQIFVDSISGILDAWETFSKNQISFVTTYAQEKEDYPWLLDSIYRSMSELGRLRSLLLTQRARIKSKLENFHTVASLSQTNTAISQGENIRTLTQMTVYVAFPLLFTAAIFSMDFAQPHGPQLTWGLFFTVLVTTAILNGSIAWILYTSIIPRMFTRVIEWWKSLHR